MMKLENECGVFSVDSKGVLQAFVCARENVVIGNIWRCLDIPEGIRVIPDDAFRWCNIQERLTFPKSLRVIGSGDGCAFANSKLPHVELPDTLEELGDFVFGNSTMVSLRIPKGLKSEYARQFKGSRIGTLYLPEDFRAEDTPRGFCEKYEWGKEQYGYIRSLLVNDVEIGNVVFY